jgi:hypothetical protein
VEGGVLIARRHLWRQPRHDTLRWHLSSTALTIWITRTEYRADCRHRKEGGLLPRMVETAGAGGPMKR